MASTLCIGGREFAWGSRTFVMGVVNVTPDSFSGDGLLTGAAGGVDAAVELALRLEDEGADIIDIGGESSRPRRVYPDARPVPEAEELRRVLPVIEGLAGRLAAPISIDTVKAAVAEAAVGAGAAMVNDVSMLTADAAMAATVGRLGVPLVISHTRERAVYRDVVAEVIADLQAAVRVATDAGVSPDAVILDPGIGFGKTPAQSLQMQRRLGELAALGHPLLIGASRKSSIGAVLGLPPHERVEGTAATVALAIERGADIVRVHDVRQMARVARMSDAIVRGWQPPG
ncbi:MAG: dihydropteroate synthase [Dehalococcoidia bacterium]